MSTLEGVPWVYSLVPAHTDEREAAESVLQFIQGCDILVDKGFTVAVAVLLGKGGRGSGVTFAVFELEV